MKVTKRVKKTVALFVGILMTIMGMGKAAEATVWDTFPTDEKGTITIIKYQDDTESTWDTSDTGQTEPVGKTPLEGVTFTIKKVGTMSQKSENGQVSLEFTVEEAVKTALGLDSVSTTSTALDEALKNAYTTDKKVADSLVTGGIEKITDSLGTARFEELEQGLYLVAETKTPSNVTAKSVPFFVSIPSVINRAEGNTQWETDIKAYPKNVVSSPEISKTITAVGGETEGINQSTGSQASAGIGDLITYVVGVSAIVPADGLAVLEVKDTMGKGLTFITESVKIYPLDELGVRQNPLEKGDHFTISEKSDGNEVEFLFQTSYLETLAHGSTQKYEIEYQCKLNENAILGQEGNDNTVTLSYSNDPLTKTEYEEKPETKIYTYGIDLTKNGENDLLEGVEFALTDENGNEIKLTHKNGSIFYTDSSGNENKAVTTEDGKISIRGLKPGTYVLTETKTNQGYLLLKNPITIVISQKDAITGEAEATVDGKSVTMINDTDSTNSATALVVLTVVNHKGFDLPKTGASGTAIFALAGIILVLVAGVLLFLRKRTTIK